MRWCGGEGALQDILQTDCFQDTGSQTALVPNSSLAEVKVTRFPHTATCCSRISVPWITAHGFPTLRISSVGCRVALLPPPSLLPMNVWAGSQSRGYVYAKHPPTPGLPKCPSTHMYLISSFRFQLKFPSLESPPGPPSLRSSLVIPPLNHFLPKYQFSFTTDIAISTTLSSASWFICAQLCEHIPITPWTLCVSVPRVHGQLSHVWLPTAGWTGARQAPLPTGFPGQECWSRLPDPAFMARTDDIRSLTSGNHFLKPAASLYSQKKKLEKLQRMYQKKVIC